MVVVVKIIVAMLVMAMRNPQPNIASPVKITSGKLSINMRSQ